MSGALGFHVWGAGVHGKVVADVIRSAGGEVVGYIDTDREKLGEVVDGQGAEVVLLQAELMAMLEEGERPDGWEAVVVAIGDNEVRWELNSRLEAGERPTVVHPSATIAASAELGAGTVVCANATVNPGARVGDGVIVNTGAIVEHDARVGDGAHVAPNATLCGVTRVGARTLIGAGSTVIETCEVGDDCSVGAGAVVVRDVGDGATVVGSPAGEA
jgi:acetyltransferase EpsM